MPIAFKNPPINEVVAATYFDPQSLNLRSEHMGLFWERIRHEFPVVSQQFPVGIGPEISTNEPFPMPRYWFVAEDAVNLIQIQKNAFMVNWRRRDDEYPRFHRGIKPTFDKYYGLFSEFIRKEIKAAEPTIDSCELTYVNVLERCELWTGLQDTTRIIPSFSMLAPGIDISGSPEFNCHYAYEIAADLQININIRSGVNPQQQNAPALIFEIKTVGRVGQLAKPGTDEWFERAHNAIVDCFVGMTSSDVQNRLWKRVKEAS